MLYFTSDLHFGHKNVIDYCNRPFDSVEEMNQELIKNFNSIVKPEDTTFFLGDIFFCSNSEAKILLSQMNGTKILIKGNHDQNANAMYSIGFSAVMESAMIKLGKTKIMLSHYPYKRTAWNHFLRKYFDKKYRSKLHFNKLDDKGLWLLHGHTHDKSKLNKKMIHVGVDAWSFKPVSASQISSIVDSGRVKT